MKICHFLNRKRYLIANKEEIEMIKPTAAEFSISGTNRVIGNYKYGNIKRAQDENLFSSKDGFTIHLNQKANRIYKTNKKTMAFYSIKGEIDVDSVSSERKFFNFLSAYLEIHDLHTNKVEVRYNNLHRLYSLTKFSKSGSIGELLADITTLKLLEKGALSFHGGCVALNGQGIVLTGLPDVGKTFTTMKILEKHKSAKFLAEDIFVLDEEGNVRACPLTQTVEKRRKLRVFERLYSFVYEAIIRNNLIKTDILDYMPEARTRIQEKIRPGIMFFLKKGPYCEKIIDDKRQIFEELIKLNHLEFNYSRNRYILTSLYFVGNKITDYMETEKSLIEKFVNSVKIVEIHAPSPEMYYDAIQKYI